MIELKLGEAVGAESALQRLLGERMAVKASYRLSRIYAKLRVDLDLYQAHRAELIKRLGTDKGDGTWVIEPGTEALKEFNVEMEKLLQEALKVDLAPVKIEDMGNVSLAPADLLACAKFIIE